MLGRVRDYAGETAALRLMTPLGRLDERQMRAVVDWYNATGAGGLGTVVHDVMGLARDDEHFLPKIKDLQEA